MPKYIVKKGDCLESIAFQYGHFWETVWDAPENEELKQTRKHHDVLKPGDELHVPAIRLKEIQVETGKEHVFVVKSIPVTFKLRIQDEWGEPRSDIPYTLSIDKKTKLEGTTDKDGVLVEKISPLAKRGVLKLGDAEEELELLFGSLDPISEIGGIQQRLNNLFYTCGAEDGELGPKTTEILERFQRDEGLMVTGELDDETRKALDKRHGT